MNPAFNRPGKAPSFPWFAKDTKSDVECAALDATEYGVYIRLLEFSWINYGLPADENLLNRLAKNSLGVSGYKWKKIWKILRNFFEEHDGFLFNPRQEEERSEEQKYRANQRRKSKLANIARWKQKDLDAQKPSPETGPVYPHGDPTGISEASPSLSISNSLVQLADCVVQDGERGQVLEDEIPPEPEMTPPDEEVLGKVRELTAFEINGVGASRDTVCRIALILRDEQTVKLFRQRWRDFVRRNSPTGWGIVVEIAKQAREQADSKPALVIAQEENIAACSLDHVLTALKYPEFPEAANVLATASAELIQQARDVLAKPPGREFGDRDSLAARGGV
jgi:uncharacterized protein YdaU (DUF1376 family)